MKNYQYAYEGEEDLNTRVKAPSHYESSPTSSIPPQRVLTTSTTGTNAPLLPSSSYGDQGVKTIFHIYHTKHHFSITPTLNPTKERRWVPRKKAARLARIERRHEKSTAQAWATNPQTPHSSALEHPQNPRTRKTAFEDDTASTFQEFKDDPKPAGADNNAHTDAEFFLYSPHLCFNSPPRVLRVGSPQHSHPLALLHCSLLWRTWTIQLGAALADPGVVDPRGVVSYAHNAPAASGDATALRGYKVRNWRLWGETGKSYVHAVHAARKAKRAGWVDPDTGSSAGLVGEKTINVSVAARAEEVVVLRWAAPLSRDTRRYVFSYAGVEFCWKGTGTVEEGGACGGWVRWNHLKLVARVPGETGEEPVRWGGKESEGEGFRKEVCLGTYTSSVATRKAGRLCLFDAAIWRFVVEWFPGALDGLMDLRIGEGETGEGETGDEVLTERVRALKKTRLYAVVVATAMCMVLGEKQKRETLRKVVELLADVASNMG